MKKYLLGTLAIGGMLFAASCSNEEFDSPSGNDAKVTFTLNVEDGVQTRAISDGKSADKLVYAVFDSEGNQIQTIQQVTKTGVTFPATETITLAKGQKYTVVFWAQDADCAAYNTDNLKDVTVDYNGMNNDETRDAFFKAETFTVTGSTSVSVVMKRPFAQINVGVYQEDWDAAVASGINVTKSSAVITNAATSINLLTGQVSGEAEVTYTPGTIPAKFETPETLDVDLDGNGSKENYVYLSMGYILANDATTGDAKTTLDKLAFAFQPENGNTIEFTDGLTSVPVQRNWRTNIIGKILTGDMTFNISIDPIYDGENNNGEALPVSANGKFYENIADAITDGATEIKLAASDEMYILPAISGKSLRITGTSPAAKIDLTNTVTLSGTSVEFENVTIVKENENYQGFHHAGDLVYNNCVFENEYWAYGTSETFNNCVFNQTANSNYNVWTYGAKTATFNDCTFNSAGKAVLVYKETGTEWFTANFYNCTFNASEAVAGKAAIEIDSSLNPYYVNIDNCTANGFANGSVSNNPLYNLKKGEEPTNCVIVVNGRRHIADGVDFEVASKTFEVSNANGLVYLSENKLKANENIRLTDNINLADVEFKGLDAFNPGGKNTFDGAGFTISNMTMNMPSTDDLGFIRNWVGDIKNVTIKDANIKAKGRIAIVAAKPYGNIENVHVVGGSIESSYWACGAISGLYNAGSMKNCSVTGTKIKSNGGTGGIVGVINETSGARNFVNCDVKDCDIINTDMFGSDYPGAAIAGMINVDNATVTFDGCDVINCNIDTIYGLCPETSTVIVK